MTQASKIIPIIVVTLWIGAPSVTHAIHPVVVYASEYLAGKLLDEAFDRVTGRPDVKLLDKRLKEFEAGAAIRSDMRNEIQKLREAVKNNITRDEFRRMAERTSSAIGEIQQRLDDLEERVEMLEVENGDIRGLTRAAASDPRTFIQRGLRHEAQGFIFKAIACYNIAIRLTPSKVEPYLRRGWTYQRMGAPRVAIVDATEAIRLGSTSATEGYYLRGLALISVSEDQRAVADLTESLRRDDQQSQALFSRGAAYVRLGKKAEAAKDYAAAIRLDLTDLWFLAGDKPVQGFTTIRPSSFSQNESARQILEVTPFMVTDYAGIDASLIERTNFIGDDDAIRVLHLTKPLTNAEVGKMINSGVHKADFEFKQAEVGMFTVQNPYPAAAIRALAKKFEQTPESKRDLDFKLKALGEMMFAEQKPTGLPSFCLVNSRTLVVGEKEHLVIALTRSTPPQLSPNLAEVVKLVDWRASFCKIMDFTETGNQMAKEKTTQLAHLDIPAAVKNLRAIIVSGVIDDPTALRLTAVCTDSNSATSLKPTIESVIQIFLAEIVTEMKKEDKTPPQLLIDYSRKVNFSISGNLLELSVSVPAKAAIDIYKR